MGVRFNDYVGNPIIPTECVLVRSDRPQEYVITDVDESIPTGYRTGGYYNANWKIENDTMIATGPAESVSREITAIYNFKLISLTTSEKSYTKFKYIQ